jgi:hypothetical protein
MTRRAHVLLEKGWRVEVHVKQMKALVPQHIKDAKEDAFLGTWSKGPHLWPEVVVKAMPDGTKIVLRPMTDWWEVV